MTMHNDPLTEPIDDPLDPLHELEELGLTEEELDAALDGELVPIGIEELFEPDDDLAARMTARVEERLAAREAIAALVELAGLGWFTFQALFDEGD